MNWFAIRTIYHFGTQPDGTNIFEERIVVFKAKSWSDAYHKAKIESETYARGNDFTIHPEQVGYEQDGEPLIDGYEVWSELFQADASLEEFYSKRYSQYKYEPESI